MKKNLFYLFALICSMSLFTACSDDDGPSAWEQIPQTAISGSNATLTVNGSTVTGGTVQMSVSNESEGVLTLTNVVPGYANVPVDVELSAVSDNSFRFAGTKELRVAPTTREPILTPVLMTVNVDGTITLDGKVTVNVSTTGSALHLGTYTGDNLTLTYEDGVLMGKTVMYSLQNDIPVLTLIDVVPGELTTSFIPVYIDNSGNFKVEKATSTNGNTVTVEGNMANGKMTIAVDVDMANMGGLEGDWNLSRNLYANGYLANTAVQMTWIPADYTQPNALQASQMVNLMVSNLLAEVLEEVDFDDDGTITADFNAQEKKIQGDVLTWIMTRMNTQLQTQPATLTVENTVWTDSDDRGKNLAFWYVKDGLLYIKLNVENIMATLAANGKIDPTMMSVIPSIMQAVANGDKSSLVTVLQNMGIDLSQLGDEMLTKLLTSVQNWLTYGIPLRYEVSGSNLHLYADKAMCEQFMPLAFAYLSKLQAELTEKAQTEAMNGNMQVAQTMQQFMQMLGISSLTDLQSIWENNTQDFNIGINLIKN